MQISNRASGPGDYVELMFAYVTQEVWKADTEAAARPARVRCELPRLQSSEKGPCHDLDELLLTIDSSAAHQTSECYPDACRSERIRGPTRQR